MVKGVLIAAAAILLASAPAASAPPIPGYVKQLQRQVAVLQAQVADFPNQLQAARDRGDCLAALAKDNDDALFKIIGLMSQRLGDPPVPTPIRADDGGACQRSGIPRR